MEKPMKTRSSSRRDFLKKSALGVASAGLLGADVLRGPGSGSEIQNNQPEDNGAATQTKKAKQKHYRPVKGTPGKRTMERIMASDQDEVFWEAPKDTDIAIMFPPGRDPAKVGTTMVKAGKQSKVFTITAPTTTRQTYKYCVFCYATNEYAQGNSEPEMIVP